MTKQMIILDCDTRNEIDDQFAITYALKSPSLQVEGVVSVQNHSVHGVDSVDIYHEEALKVLSLNGSNVPAFKGSRCPLQSVDAPATSEGVTFLHPLSGRPVERSGPPLLDFLGSGSCILRYPPRY